MRHDLGLELQHLATEARELSRGPVERGRLHKLELPRYCSPTEGVANLRHRLICLNMLILIIDYKTETYGSMLTSILFLMLRARLA